VATASKRRKRSRPSAAYAARPAGRADIDEANGRAKQAAGALSGDKRLKTEGRVEEAKGSAKNTVDKVADTLTGRKGRKG
jgi:uncharacterized protein YjbJ (UPF0337 family)